MNKSRSFLIGLVILAIVSVMAIPAVSASAITVKVDGKALSLDVAPVVESGRALVPIRAISEALGAMVKWNSSSKTITMTTCNTKVELTVDKTTAYVDGRRRKQRRYPGTNP